jgi:hypothetical protein
VLSDTGLELSFEIPGGREAASIGAEAHPVRGEAPVPLLEPAPLGGDDLYAQVGSGPGPGGDEESPSRAGPGAEALASVGSGGEGGEDDDVHPFCQARDGRHRVVGEASRQLWLAGSTKTGGDEGAALELRPGALQRRWRERREPHDTTPEAGASRSDEQFGDEREGGEDAEGGSSAECARGEELTPRAGEGDERGRVCMEL